jgi:ribosomal protein S27AE
MLCSDKVIRSFLNSLLIFEGGTRMRIRPGRTRSLVAGVLVLVVMVAGLAMMSWGAGISRPGPLGGGALGLFRWVWIIVGLVGAGLAFYNAFSRRGVSLYEIEMQETRGEGKFCPQCGEPVGEDDRFCRHCGAHLV